MRKPLKQSLRFAAVLTAGLLSALILDGKSSADQITLSNYHLSPVGSYDRVRLIPRPAIGGGSCERGTLFVNADDNNTLYFCSSDTPSGVWRPIADVWKLEDNNITLADFDPNDPFEPSLLVGIGTETPEFRLTLDNDGGLIAKGAYGEGTQLSTAGAGVRLIWYPRKGAFRAGRVTSTQWNNGNIGDYSVAMGYNALASSDVAVSLGYETSANELAMAVGRNATADGLWNVALGSQVTSNGMASTAIGENVISSGTASLAIGGEDASATGDFSVSLGSGNASGYASFTTGADVTASGGWSTALGVRTTASGNSSFVMGVDCIASGHWVNAFGVNTRATGNGSSALGSNTFSSGHSSVAMGQNTRAVGNLAYAFGQGLQVSGHFSFGIALNDQTGTILSRQNTMAILGGNVGIDRLDPQHPLHMASGARVLSNGNICTAADVCLDTVSDERLKKNIAPLTGSLDKLLRLQGVSFSWKDEDDRGREFGFLAQQVEPIFPQWVAANPEGLKVMDLYGFEALAVEALREIQTQLNTKVHSTDERIEHLQQLIERESRPQTRSAADPFSEEVRQ